MICPLHFASRFAVKDINRKITNCEWAMKLDHTEIAMVYSAKRAIVLGIRRRTVGFDHADSAVHSPTELVKGMLETLPVHRHRLQVVLEVLRDLSRHLETNSDTTAFAVVELSS